VIINSIEIEVNVNGHRSSDIKIKKSSQKNTVPVYFQFSKKAQTQTREEQVVFSPTQMPMVRVRSKGNIGNYCVVAVYSVLGWCGGMAWMCEKQ
jgi:hypothetical protein